MASLCKLWKKHLIRWIYAFLINKKYLFFGGSSQIPHLLPRAGGLPLLWSATISFFQCMTCTTSHDDHWKVGYVKLFYVLFNFSSLFSVHICWIFLPCSWKRDMLTDDDCLSYFIEVIRTRNGGNSTKACSATESKYLSI